jgi:hypothetical protein
MTKAGLLASTSLPVGEQQLLSTAAASAYLLRVWGVKRSIRTFQELRRTGRGPAFRASGNDVMYAPAALDQWVRERFATEVRSTSELSELRRLAATAEAEG